MDGFIRVRKRDLPKLLIVEDDNGDLEVQELAPGGKKKLGAYVRSVGHGVKEVVLSMIRKR